MDFRRGRTREEPEINLIPMIDVLLVIIIFLMLTTTYAKFSGLEINLPTADSAKQPERFTPTPMVLRQRCRRPARQFRQCPQVICPSPDTRSPIL